MSPLFAPETGKISFHISTIISTSKPLAPRFSSPQQHFIITTDRRCWRHYLHDYAPAAGFSDIIFGELFADSASERLIVATPCCWMVLPHFHLLSSCHTSTGPPNGSHITLFTLAAGRVITLLAWLSALAAADILFVSSIIILIFIGHFTPGRGSYATSPAAPHAIIPRQFIELQLNRRVSSLI